MERKTEYFTGCAGYYGVSTGTSLSTIKETFPQERDWTCGLACFRTLLSATYDPVISEDTLIKYLQRKPGPVSSEDFIGYKHLFETDTYKLQLGAEKPIENNLCGELTTLLKTHNVMVACTLNGGHWLVILGYLDLGTIEEDKIIFYDPYYNDVRTFRADEFLSMWVSTDGDLDHDYIAVPKGDLNETYI